MKYDVKADLLSYQLWGNTLNLANLPMTAPSKQDFDSWVRFVHDYELPGTSRKQSDQRSGHTKSAYSWTRLRTSGLLTGTRHCTCWPHSPSIEPQIALSWPHRRVGTGWKRWASKWSCRSSRLVANSSTGCRCRTMSLRTRHFATWPPCWASLPGATSANSITTWVFLYRPVYTNSFPMQCSLSGFVFSCLDERSERLCRERNWQHWRKARTSRGAGTYSVFDGRSLSGSSERIAVLRTAISSAAVAFSCERGSLATIVS